ncbi:hypothetical protein A4X13_0g1376 [Tilletia indica]|uniref:CST complex subunit STN1 n=1 Tax=Tilletia indica TaxID=43049 RepID=A0A8T8TEB3_9BASI|nr:hypothetical protein A4X13_0g1376 [Tilletia indica]
MSMSSSSQTLLSRPGPSTSKSRLEIRIPPSTSTSAGHNNSKGKARALDPPTSLTGHDLTNIQTAGRIYAWADHPSNAVKCFGSHILSAYLLSAEGFPQSVYLLERRPFIYAEIVGMIVGVTEKERRTIYLVDDGTTVLQVIDLPPRFGRAKLHKVGDVIRVIGKVRHEWEERALHAHSMNLLSDLHAEIQHIHAVVEVLRTAYQEPLDLASLPTAHFPSPTAPDRQSQALEPEQPRKTTIPPEYLPPVYTDPNYYSNAVGVVERRPLPQYPMGPTLPSPETTPPAKSTTRHHYYNNAFPLFPSSPPSIAPSSSSMGEGSSFGSSRHRRLRAWNKLSGSELSASRFRPYVAQHIHTFCSASAGDNAASISASSSSSSAPAFTVRYLRRQDDLRKHAESVVLRELEKRERKSKSSTSTATLASSSRQDKTKSTGDPPTRKQAAKLSSEALAAKVKRLFESIIRQLVDDGVIEIAPECLPLQWPFNGRKLGFKPSKPSTARLGGRGHPAQKKWGGTAAEMFLSAEDVEIPFLGSSDSETETQGQQTKKGKGTTSDLLRTPTQISRRAGTSRQRIVIEIPSSSGASAVLDSQGRTRTPVALSSRPTRHNAKDTKRRGGTNAFDDAISISSGSGSGSSSESRSSSGGITTDTESESSSDDGEEGRTSPTPRAKRRTLLGKGMLLDTQRAADVWRQGGGTGKGSGRKKGRQEAYRLRRTS